MTTPLRATHPRRLASSLAIAACVLATGTACSSGEGSDDEAQTPAEVLAGAEASLAETSGVTLDLTTPELPEGIDGVLKASGVGTNDPAFDGQITARVNSISVDVPVVSVDGTVYAKLPFTKKFVSINPADYGAPDPADLLDPAAGISGWLTSAEGIEEGESTRDGELVLTSYTGTLPGGAVDSVIPSADEKAEFDVVFTIDDEGLLNSAEVAGPFYTGSPDVTYTVTVRDYGTTQAISAP